MFSGIPVAWLQLKHEPARLGAALAGVAFAVVLVFMQLGFHDALFVSAVRLHDRLRADLVMASPRSGILVQAKSIPRRRLYQAAGFDGVASVAPLYLGRGVWKNPYTGKGRQIFVAGFDPAQEAFDLAAVNATRHRIRLPDQILFDRGARPEFGPIPQDFLAGKQVAVEVNDHRVTVAGLFEVGVSFGSDGTIITSDENFLRLFPGRSPGVIELGLIRLKPGTDAEHMRGVLAAALPRDVLVFTKQGFADSERNFWKAATPIGYIFSFGSLMGLVVGGVIVYQILFTDIASHLPEYATLKAMGYRNGYLFSIVLQEALILAALGYVPGIVLAGSLYRVTADATHLPMSLSLDTSLVVFGLTVLMCSGAGAIALRKLRAADPADVF